jgi:hypothetical protein
MRRCATSSPKVAVEPQHERAAVGAPELDRDVLRENLALVERERGAEVAQLVDVHRRVAERHPDRIAFRP